MCYNRVEPKRIKAEIRRPKSEKVPRNTAYEACERRFDAQVTLELVRRSGLIKWPRAESAIKVAKRLRRVSSFFALSTQNEAVR